MPHPLLPDDPTQVGPYTLHARLGGGGMGQVFLGRSPGGHTVAVKVVRPDLAQDPDFRRRFATEVAAARKVGGFYTAPVVDADTDATPPWLTTAYIPGPTLHRAVTDHGPLPPETVAVLGAGLAEGLAAVHAQGVVHRDLKPANVLLAADGPRLIDFGIARALDTTSHTHSSTVLGTAAFMSPEQARAEKVGPASDVFSLGCVLAFAATSRSPFGEGAPLAVMFRLVQGGPDLTGVPEPLVGLVRACLAKDPGSRPPVEEAVAALAAAAPSRSGGDESWLPPNVTEVLNRYTLTYTRAETGKAGELHSPRAETRVAARPKSWNSAGTDQTPFTVEALLPSDFTNDKAINFAQVAAGIRSCAEALKGKGALDVAEVLEQITTHGCTEVMVGLYQEQPGPRATPDNPVLVSVTVFPFPDLARSRLVHKYLTKEPRWHLTTWHRRSRVNFGPLLPEGKYFRWSHVRYRHRYVIAAMAYRADLSRASSIGPFLQAAAVEAADCSGPQNHEP